MFVTFDKYKIHVYDALRAFASGYVFAIRTCSMLRHFWVVGGWSDSIPSTCS